MISLSWYNFSVKVRRQMKLTQQQWTRLQ